MGQAREANNTTSLKINQQQILDLKSDNQKLKLEKEQLLEDIHSQDIEIKQQSIELGNISILKSMLEQENEQLLCEADLKDNKIKQLEVENGKLIGKSANLTLKNEELLRDTALKDQTLRQTEMENGKLITQIMKVCFFIL